MRSRNGAAAKKDKPLDFVPTHPKAGEALAWMGFEARSAILEVLDQAIADQTAQVRAVVYDLNEPGIVSRLEKLKTRLKIIIDDDGAHGKPGSGETEAAGRLKISAGAANVKRQHMGKLQHNKTIVVDGPMVQAAVCGSTNHSWRGFFVQNNNAIILRGEKPVKVFMAAFSDYWANDDVVGFGKTGSARWNDLGLTGIDAQIGFSPRAKTNAVLAKIGEDIAGTTSSLFFSLAFLYQTKGVIQDAIKKIKKDNQIFSYGISDHKVSGIEDAAGVDNAEARRHGDTDPPFGFGRKNVPEPFKSEPTGGSGTRLHHKFVVIDFNQPSARVYMGSYNFSTAADISNGENLLLIRDRRIAVSYVVEAVRLFRSLRVQSDPNGSEDGQEDVTAEQAAAKRGDTPWWTEDYAVARKIRDRELFAQSS